MLAVAGLALLVLAPSTRWSLLGGVLVLIGSLSVAAVVVIEVVRRELLGHVDYVNRVVEQGVIEVLPPGRVADRLLERIYGPSPFNQPLATALLGGEGLMGDAADLTISEHTEIDYRLVRVDDANYQLVMRTHYSFRNRIPSRRLVIFATSDETLRDRIVVGCRFPLFESWFVREDETKTLFEDSVESILQSVAVGLEYEDDRGQITKVPARHPSANLHEVKVRDWGRYLTFFGTDGDNGWTIDRQQYMDRLRIFEIDLHDHAGAEGLIGPIQRLTLESTTLQAIDDGFCWWQAPYPCFVERMGFDTGSFDLPGGEDLRFLVKPFATAVGGAPAPWRTSDRMADVALQVWMLAGHGMALIWRPAERSESGAATRGANDRSATG
ncbi:hypothetical protein WCD74_00715 [Actinomycetospora sp. OC33-EN08]|uniref:DUF3137 domain-containing protein n=1 Tax=Actinomycetospora aurantiaca TaxID=3129233 RepID=A0ABU8MH56_9PSEU